MADFEVSEGAVGSRACIPQNTIQRTEIPVPRTFLYLFGVVRPSRSIHLASSFLRQTEAAVVSPQLLNWE